MDVCYKIVDGSQTIIHKPKDSLNLEGRYTEFKGYKLPISSRTVDFGRIVGSNDNDEIIIQSRENEIVY